MFPSELEIITNIWGLWTLHDKGPAVKNKQTNNNNLVSILMGEIECIVMKTHLMLLLQ